MSAERDQETPIQLKSAPVEAVSIHFSAVPRTADNGQRPSEAGRRPPPSAVAVTSVALRSPSARSARAATGASFEIRARPERAAWGRPVGCYGSALGICGRTQA